MRERIWMVRRWRATPGWPENGGIAEIIERTEREEMER